MIHRTHLKNKAFSIVQTYSHITVGVRSLKAASHFWTDVIGLHTEDHQTGPNPVLAGLWGLQADDISAQALLRQSPQLPGLHLIEFANPEPPVRLDAPVVSRLPKNIDIYTQDLPATYEHLSSLGYRFRSNWSETESHGIRFREVHMAGHDDTNIVLLQILDQEMDWTPQGFAAVGALVCTVDDANQEAAFHQSLLGLDMIMDNRLAGPEIESLIGLPKGSGLQVRLLGDENDWMGRLEIIEYENLPGENRYPRAVPPALGCLHVNYFADNPEPITNFLNKNSIPFERHNDVSLIYGEGDLLRLQAPGGLHLEILIR